ncbi:MAG: maltotransferase domain-containing protein [Actinomycetota bacterium]
MAAQAERRGGPVDRGPRIYNLFPPLVGPISRWVAELPRIAALGFDWVWVNPFHYPGFSGSLYAIKDYLALNPLFADEGAGPPEVQLSAFTAAARGHDLRVMMDLVVNHTSKDALLVGQHPDWYARTPAGELKSPGAVDPDDPAKVTEWGDLAEIDYGRPDLWPALVEHWGGLVQHYARLGFAGFRCDAAYKVPAEVWAGVVAMGREVDPTLHFAAETLGCPTEAVAALHRAGFDWLFNSAKWWDFHAPWLLEQYDLFRAIAPSIAFPESHDTPRLGTEVQGDEQAWYRLRAWFSAFFSAGWMMPMGYEWGWTRPLDVVATRPDDREPVRFDLSAVIAEVNRTKAATPAMNVEGPQRRLTDASSPLVVLLRTTPDGRHSALLAMNVDPVRTLTVEPARLASGVEGLPTRLVLPPLGAQVCAGHAATAQRPRAAAERAAALPMVREDPGLPDTAAPGILILAVAPCVDGGRFPVKREEGDSLEVSADILKDGHDLLAARVLWREVGADRWRAEPMALADNDRWLGRVRLDRPGRVAYTIEAWVDAYETWRSDLGKKRAADQPVAVELAEGRQLLDAATARMEGDDRARMETLLAGLDDIEDEDERADVMVSTLVRGLMARWPDRSRAVRHDKVYEVVVDRVRARFAAWYEMMARSQGTDPQKSATFKDCERRLPDIARMGFDVVYLLPIHPIGRVHRKGPDNTLVAGEDDPGSPYAIGSDEGGHTAVHPELGTLDDFRRFLSRARELGMEIALDFAIQCAPDHPWVRQHPDWFVFRPDGTIRYAENPPKKYQDIVNVDFHGTGAPGLWRELREVVLFWVREGVRIFRVDNPHTKPIPFWEWLIRSVQDAHPDVVFLSEAFTRPKMMKALAKIGFTQSYTYFTWRTFKAEITAYFQELAHGEGRDYLRPMLFPTTPDILPPFLQTGGRAAFRIRLVLAATLSPLYGIYNGYELCEGAAIPGKEEYLHSEKYQYKVWDWNRPGNIKEEIARINAIRRENPALHELENLAFHDADDEAVLFYSKVSPDRSSQVFVAVTLDPFDVREAELSFPLAHMGVPEGETFEVEELLTGRRHLWRGARHRIRFDPAVAPAVLFRVTVWSSVDYRTPCL